MNYKELADHSRVWIYQSSRELNEEELGQITKAGKEFIANWATHGTALKAAMEVFHNRFIVLFADEAAVKASGCSIDSSVHFMKEVEKAFSIRLFDRMQVAYRTSEGIESKNMNQLTEEVEQGKISPETRIFNNLIESKSDFESKWEVPIKDSWLAPSLPK